MKLLFVSLAFTCAAFAADAPPLNELLRQGLFDEEATRDLDKAVKSYEALIQRYSVDRKYAGTALFRLAEIKRKQGSKDAAIGLYQRVLSEFPEDETLTKISRENLVALGARPIEPTASPEVDAEQAEIARLEALFKSSPDLVNSEQGASTTGEPGNPPLHAAAIANQQRVVAYLLDHGADIQLRDAKGWRALDRAAAAGHLELVKFLVEKGADIHGENYGAPFGSAYTNKRTLVARYLIEKGADPNVAYRFPVVDPDLPTEGLTITLPLIHAIKRKDTEIIDLLLAHKADPNKSEPTTRQGGAASAMVVAAEEGDAASLKKLLDAGGKPDGPENAINTPLTAAIGAESRECVKLLIDAKATVRGTRAMELAAEKADEALLRLLLDTGADINEPAKAPPHRLSLSPDQRKKLTPLIITLTSGKATPSLIKFMLERGAKADPELLALALQSANDKQLGAVFYPQLTAKPQITLMPRHLVWKTRETDVLPDCSELGWLSATSEGGFDGASFVIVRLEETTKELRRIPFDLVAWAKEADAAKLPKLQWGDVLELDAFPNPPPEPSRPAQPPGGSSLGSYPVANPTFGQPGLGGQPIVFQTESFAGTVGPALRSAKRVPFKLTVDGVTKDFILHGGLTLYDPTTNLVPLNDYNGIERGLAATLCLLGGADPRLNSHEVQWQQASGKTLTISIQGNASGKSISAGDQFIIRPRDDNSSDNQSIFITCPGYCVSERLDYLSGTGPQTLGETLADFFSRSNIVLPHPDWSGLVVRRWDKDKAQYQPVLPATMAVDGIARPKLDLPLQPGDIIELPLKQAEQSKPWTGLDAGTLAWFDQHLTRSVKLELNGETSSHRVKWIAPKFEKQRDVWQRLAIPEDEQGEGRLFGFTAFELLRSLNPKTQAIAEHTRCYISSVTANKNIDGGSSSVLIRNGDVVQCQLQAGVVPGAAPRPQVPIQRRRALNPAQ